MWKVTKIKIHIFIFVYTWSYNRVRDAYLSDELSKAAGVQITLTDILAQFV